MMMQCLGRWERERRKGKERSKRGRRMKKSRGKMKGNVRGDVALGKPLGCFVEVSGGSGIPEVTPTIVEYIPSGRSL